MLLKHATPLFLAALIGLAACGGDDQAPAPAVQTEAPVQQAGPPAELSSQAQGYTSAWNGDDPAAVAPFFMEDATAVVGDSTYTGRAEIQQRWLNTNVPAITGLQTQEQTQQQQGADWVVTGTYRTTVTAPGAEPAAQTGRYTIHWGQAPDGQWRIRRQETYSDPAPAS